MDWVQLLADPNLAWILMGTMLLGISSGIIGCFAYLRKQALMGDALSHAALPGVCIAFMLTGMKSIPVFLAGAMIAGIVSTFAIGYITRESRIKQDASLGIILTVFFGLGIMLLTKIQHGNYGNQSGLDTFLFGQAAGMVHSDVSAMAVLCVLLVVATFLFFKEFKLVSFDPGFAKGIGLPVKWLEQAIMLLVVVAVVAGIQAVGVVLMSALLITPAVAARYWTNKLHVMVILSGLFGAISGLSGSLLSTMASNLPTGPLVVLSATFLFVVSLLFAPAKGLIAQARLRWQVKRKFLGVYQVPERVEKEGV